MHKWSVLWRFLKCNVQGFTFSRILLRLHCCLCIVYTTLVVALAYLSISSSIANKVNTNLCLVLNQTLYCPHYLMGHCSYLYNVHNNNSNNLFVRFIHLHYSSRWIFTTAIFKPRLLFSHSTSHKADWILTAACFLLCLAIWYAQVISLMKVFELLHCCLCIVYTTLVVALAYLSIHFPLTIVVVGLLGTSSIFNCVAFVYRLMLHCFYFHNNNAYKVIVFIFDNYELYS